MRSIHNAIVQQRSRRSQDLLIVETKIIKIVLQLKSIRVCIIFLIFIWNNYYIVSAGFPKYLLQLKPRVLFGAKEHPWRFPILCVYYLSQLKGPNIFMIFLTLILILLSKAGKFFTMPSGKVMYTRGRRDSFLFIIISLNLEQVRDTD